MNVQFDLLATAAHFQPGGKIVTRSDEKNFIAIQLPSGYKNCDPYLVHCQWIAKASSIIFSTWFHEQSIPIERKSDGEAWAQTMSEMHSDSEVIYSKVGCAEGKVMGRGKRVSDVLLFYTCFIWNEPPNDSLDISHHFNTLSKAVNEADCVMPMLESFRQGRFEKDDPSITKSLIEFSYFEIEARA